MNDLPSDMSCMNSCCFTGHRVIPSEKLDYITADTERAVRILAEAGYRYFICGGALGYDTLAAQVVLKVAEEYPIKLFLALPCRNQTEKWMNRKGGEESIREYQRLKALATGIHYVCDFYRDGCMKERNLWMVEHSSFCIAYYNGSPKSGAGQTYRLARDNGNVIYNVFDASVENDDIYH